jgi:hypothetical protein
VTIEQLAMVMPFEQVAMVMTFGQVVIAMTFEQVAITFLAVANSLSKCCCQKMLHFYTLLFSQCVQRKKVKFRNKNALEM